MGYPADGRGAAGLWACILLSLQRISLATTIYEGSLIQSQYTCYDDDFLCPVLEGEPTLRCGPACFLPGQDSCSNGFLVSSETAESSSPGPVCSRAAAALQLSDPPSENYFYSDCNTQVQVVVTSPLPESNLSIIGPRLVVAWPAGNSGACAFFEPQNGVNGSLSLEMIVSPIGTNLTPVYMADSDSQYPSVGVKGTLRFNSSARLTVPILGSVRTIRDFTEGPSLLRPVIQDAIVLNPTNSRGASLSRLWLDNVTTTTLSFEPQGNGRVHIEGGQIAFEAGDYTFSAHFNYPQLKQLTTQEVFKPESQGLATQMANEAISLAFLSYTEKLLAGAWRFLTYFGRDSMISALLLEPVLSQGNGSALEAVIGAVLERLNKTDGTACHEETIGDYATYLHLENNITSTEPKYDYAMIDTDYFLPVLMQRYFLETETGRSRSGAFLSIMAGEVNPHNKGLTFGDLARRNAERIMTLAAPFATPGGQSQDNLIHLKDDTLVGQWRDSTYGSGGGRIPYDVNTALVPAALRAIASLSRFNSSIYPGHEDWAELADKYAQVWEDETLPLFQVVVPADEARMRLERFSASSEFYNGPSHADTIDDNVTYYGLALEGNNDIDNVDVLNTDDCFRLFLLNTTNDVQLSSFLNQSALNILRPFPAGLMTPVGVVIANPALAKEDVLRANFTNSAYHGTVIWGWQLAMLARGFETQLDRCHGDAMPAFCKDETVYGNVMQAYNALWDNLEQNGEYLAQEVWSWVYRDDGFHITPLGSLPPPPGVQGGTESNVIQLWSLTFLAVARNEALR